MMRNALSLKNMKIYDITQELFTCCVFPKDPAPEKRQVLSMEKGDMCNLTELSLCAHNGTHMDAPLHFCRDGKAIDEIDLNRVIGEAEVIAFEGELRAFDVERIINENTPKRILFQGKTVITLEAAKALNRHGILLVGVESQTVGPEDAPGEVHLELLGKEVVLLEGIRLFGVPEGTYFLNAAPLKLGGCDGAPCRAVLICGNGSLQDSPSSAVPGGENNG